jgi:hypothetical protein
MGSMPIVMIFIPGQDPSQVRQIPDEGPVKDLAAARPNPPFHDRIRARCPYRSLDDPDTNAVKHRVEGGHELGVAIADEELDGLGVLVKVHQEVPGLLADPRCGRVGGGPEDVDAPGGVFDDGQAVHLGAVQQVDGEEVGGDDRFGLGAQELGPGRTGPSRRGVDSGFGEDLPHRRGRNSDAKAGEFSMDSPVSPGRVLPGQAEDKTADVASGDRATRAARAGLGYPRRRSRSRCQRNTVSRVTSSRKPARRALGITPTSAAISARSAQVNLGLRTCCRWSTPNW